MTTPVKNIDIANIFDRLADLLELEGENPFRVRAYRNAAATVENLPQNLEEMVKKGDDLTSLPAIGNDLAQKINDIVNHKEIDLLKRLEEKNPIDFEELNRIQGLGPRRIKKLYEILNVQNIDDLYHAAEEQKIRNLPGFSKKIEEHILEEIKKIKEKYNRMKISTAEQNALPIVEYLRENRSIQDIEIAGSYRRRKETIGDLDILVTCEDSISVMTHFVNYFDIDEVLSKGDTRSSIILKSGIQVDLRVLPQKSYGAAMLYFTGSKAHNIVIRKLAKQKDWKVNEYGLFSNDDFLAGETEKGIYNKLGLPYIEPELRENRGEFEAAESGNLPELIKLSDIKGDLHTHTNLTDGKNTLEEMAEAAQKLGYKYIANTDHSKRVTVAGGLDEIQVFENIKRTDKLNENFKDFTILKGIEVDILEDGSLDLSDKVLKELDIVVGAIHYKFNLSREEQTERILRAMDNPYLNILAHPTGRLINEREPYDIDLEKIMQKAKENNCILEINSQPSRLDLNDLNSRKAKEMGVKLVISTDAHSTTQYDFMRFGIGQARRGWIEKHNVINTRNINQLKKIIKRN
ncbi:TPA: DNA polymerase/3'-5' exonuclease PolX [Candidatus Gastranaerophilales bacterium HUM_20]|nr:pHP domain protein [Clostridium sp. CAG:729]DAB22146.1 MAG TPA: DNA polymerase/3'-5' exonuclease PolX [Candidatus Gastranaerophilales bacterium HUM_20]